MPILANVYSLLASGMVNEPGSRLKSPLLQERRHMQTSQVVTRYLFEKAALLCICRCPVAIRNEIQGTEHGDIFFDSVLPWFKAVGVSKRRTQAGTLVLRLMGRCVGLNRPCTGPVSYTHLRAHET